MSSLKTMLNNDFIYLDNKQLYIDAIEEILANKEYYENFKKEHDKLEKQLVHLNTKGNLLVYGKIADKIFSKLHEFDYVREEEYFIYLSKNKDKNRYLYDSIMKSLVFMFKKLEFEYKEKYSNLTLSQRLIIDSPVYYYEKMLLYFKKPFINTYMDAVNYSYDPEEYIRNYEMDYLRSRVEQLENEKLERINAEM